MPKLDTKTARQVANAEGSSFTLLDEDEYVLKLDSVKVSEKPDRNGNAYWIWSFTVQSGQVTGDKFKGKTMRSNTGLAENQLWFLKMFFEAFEAKPNVNTDDLVGKEVKAIVGQSEIQSGARKGQLRNDINTMLPVTAESGSGDDWADEGEKDDEDDDDF